MKRLNRHEGVAVHILPSMTEVYAQIRCAMVLTLLRTEVGVSHWDGGSAVRISLSVTTVQGSIHIDVVRTPPYIAAAVERTQSYTWHPRMDIAVGGGGGRNDARRQSAHPGRTQPGGEKVPWVSRGVHITIRGRGES